MPLSGQRQTLRVRMRTPACGLSIIFVLAMQRCSDSGKYRRLMVKHSSNRSVRPAAADGYSRSSHSASFFSRAMPPLASSRFQVWSQASCARQSEIIPGCFRSKEYFELRDFGRYLSRKDKPRVVTLESDTTLLVQRHKEREERFKGKLKRQAQKLGYKLVPTSEEPAA